MRILQAPNPVLSQTAKPVLKADKSILNLISEMKRAMEAAIDPEGVGLAAPQIGKSLQIFIAKPFPKGKIKVFINPKIVESSKLKVIKSSKKVKKGEKQLEGCLSLKDIWGAVKRSPAITVSYLDEKGKSHEENFTGFLATIIQHEYDHLQGILFPRRVLEQKGKLYKSSKDLPAGRHGEEGEDVFEEIKLV